MDCCGDRQVQGDLQWQEGHIRTVQRGVAGRCGGAEALLQQGGDRGGESEGSDRSGAEQSVSAGDVCARAFVGAVLYATGWRGMCRGLPARDGLGSERGCGRAALGEPS